MDYQMEQLAFMHRLQNYPRQINTKSGFEEDKIDSLVQIWDKSTTLIYSSDSSLSFPITTQSGFSIITWKGEKWRILLEKGQETIQIVQAMKLREKVIFSITTKFIFIMLIFLFFLGGWVLLVIKISFNPLNNVRKQIGERKASLLTPIYDKNVPEEIRPLIKELNSLLSRLDKALKNQKRFLADAAHELRTPITALDLQIQNARYATSEEERTLVIQKLKRGINRASAVINQLLAISRMESDFLENEVMSIDIEELISRVLLDYSMIAAEQNITITFQPQRGATLLQGNAKSLEVMLSSLLDNAIKYSPSKANIWIYTLRNTNGVTISIIDQGPGIPTEERKKVFERFYRYKGESVQGSGLGLSIVKDIADFHDATISLEDGFDGKGLKVSVFFPFRAN
ncbi:MAG: ATP-binding protein [Aminobacterium sp.]|uniref:sensor histidine kinase n=1 Tax=Aminobacterium sp. MB27-C1 TaxID=3070661 RepID=UPI001BD05D4A|nr:ATP-binding protein [Aminobacterium sp. MB27-C1]MDD4228281.1 ATP-binding protein [Aminobacterium sp.]WMI71007.1 ATP-binding protein [Aminobacterium sp. MB27-C1]